MKILSRKALLRRLAADRRKKRKIVFTNGCFDLIHSGHLKVLNACKKKGNILVVGLNSDRSVRRLKGPGRPILKQRDRAELLAGFEPVDYITVFKEDTPEKLIRAVRPDVLVKGGDWKAQEIAGRAYAGQVVRVPLLKGRSTSGLIKTILKRYGRQKERIFYRSTNGKAA